MRIVGYGVCGPNEKRIVEALEDFRRLCDFTIICCNNCDQKTKETIKDFGFERVDDNREWGKYQNQIKEDFVRTHVNKLKPDVTLCKDLDEIYDPRLTREGIEELGKIGGA